MSEDINTPESGTRRCENSVEVQRLVSGLEVRVEKLKTEYDLTGCRQTQSIIACQLIELAGVICLLKQSAVSR